MLWLCCRPLAAEQGKMFENKKFDVEHALNLYADSFSLLPASAIYDEEALKPLMPVVEPQETVLSILFLSLQD
jgi:hypothetical protein